VICVWWWGWGGGAPGGPTPPPPPPPPAHTPAAGHDSKMRIGILGGTFDPIHYGHLEMACGVKALFNCDRIFIMPAYSPPHKSREAISSSYHRYAMAAMATVNLDGIEVSRLELEAPSQPYTVQTIARLKETLQDQVELFFIMGADSFRELDTWRNHQKLIESTNIVVMTRPGYNIPLDELGAKFQTRIEDMRGRHVPVGQLGDSPVIFLTDLIQRDISATAIRDAIVRGEPISQWVTETVAQYISKYRLYYE
jgi:nicotinate-nucleotide adenylyltransferase